jgi:hypothetical protein
MLSACCHACHMSVQMIWGILAHELAMLWSPLPACVSPSSNTLSCNIRCARVACSQCLPPAALTTELLPCICCSWMMHLVYALTAVQLYSRVARH